MALAPGEGSAAPGPYRVCVVGCGAIGTHIAGRLALGGRASVTVVTRGDTLRALRRGGVIHTSDASRPFSLDSVCEGVDPVGELDAVVVAVKGTQLPSLAGTLAALLRGRDERLPVFFAINGIPWYYFHGLRGPREDERLPLVDPGGALWEAVGPGRAVHVTLRTACQVLRPGEVQVNSALNVFTVCEPSGETASPRACRFAEALAAGGVLAEVKGDMRHEIWFKLLGNMSFNPVSVLTGSTIAGMSCDEALRARVLKPMIREAVAVAEALGVDTSKFPTPDQRLDLVKTMVHPSSMLQDYRAGKPLEIDAIVGQVLAFAEALGVEAPTLGAVVALVRSAEACSGKRPAEGGGEEGRGEAKAPRLPRDK